MSKKKYKPYKIKQGFVRRYVRKDIHPNFIDLFEEIKSVGGIVCGGFARWAFSMRKDSSEPTDIDVYCRTKEIYDRLHSWFVSNDFKIKAENELCVMYINPIVKYKILPPVQLIKPMKDARIVTTGTVEEILDSFDFTVCRCAITTPKTGIVDANYEHDEKNKILRIMNIHCPISSSIRFAKYYKKGYSVPPFEILKLFMDWDERTDEYRLNIIKFFQDLHDKRELSDQEIHEMERLMRID